MYTIASLLLVAILLAATIQVQERILRHRAERLLTDILAVDLRHTTFEQVGDLAARWEGFASHGVPCSSQDCDFLISFRGPDVPASSPMFRTVLQLYRALGGHAAGVVATINVRNGFVWGETYQIGLDVPPTSGGEYELIGEISTKPGIEMARLVRPSLRIHREYGIGGPAGCMGCVEIWVRFSPFVNLGEIRRLSQFNFSCLTRMRVCRTEEDIMPEAMAEARKEKSNRSEQPTCDAESARILSRDMENAAVVDVIDNRAAPRYPEDERRILKVRLVKDIKRTFFWETGAIRDVDVPAALALPPLNDLKNVRSSDRIIILFGPPTAGIAPDIGAAMCGVVPYTEANLQLVRDGAAQDDRVPPLIAYTEDYRPRKFSDPPGPPPPPSSTITNRR